MYNPEDFRRFVYIMAAKLPQKAVKMSKFKLQVLRRTLNRMHTCHGFSTTSRICSPIQHPTTIQEAREKLIELVGAQKVWGSEEGSSQTGKVLTQDELPIRTMQDSYQETYIRLGSNPVLRNKYVSFNQRMRVGRILEDLDTFAVLISYTHSTHDEQMDNHKSPVSIVTALVDRIELNRNGLLSPYEDIKLNGKVTWAGKSSLEVTMNVQQEREGQWADLLCAKFVMVARNPVTKKSAAINKLVPETDEEKELFSKGEVAKVKRHREGERTLLKMAPNEEERELIHNVFLKTLDSNAASFKARIKPENSVWMETTLLKNLHICFPEQRNLYNKIFGGYLMRKAYELAWVNASLYSKGSPISVTVDDILFLAPVEVGSLLFFSSQVVYTNGSKMQIKVHAEVVNHQDGSRRTTNDFHFTFDTFNNELATVTPKTYAESMLYLDGKRHFES